MFILRNKTYRERMELAHQRGFDAGLRHASLHTTDAERRYSRESKSSYNTKTAVCAQLRKLSDELSKMSRS